MDKALSKVITNAKTLIDAPYNQLNLDNYKEKVSSAFNIPYHFLSSPSNSPISLMSGNQTSAGILHSGIPTNKKRIFIIGKGLLFDAGGYNIKDEMNDMKTDMAGMAIAFAVASYFKDNIVAFCPVTTNFLHNNKIIPGDIIPIGRKKVEITNTDAEGRLVLAEALEKLRSYITKDDIVITVATLTGCCEYAVGTKTTAILGDNELSKQYLQSAYDVGEYAWKLPLWDYIEKEHFKKSIIQNSIKSIKADTIGAALFIKQFVPYPDKWIHLDIAASACEDGKATGVPIKSLINFIKKVK